MRLQLFSALRIARCVPALVCLAPLFLGASILLASAGRLEGQELALERYERWKLYPAPEGSEPIQALLLLFVRNDSDRLIKHWRALLVVRDSMATELFRLAIERDSADLAPNARSRVELTFRDRTTVSDEPYDHLLANDTTNLRVVFEDVRVVESGEVGYLPAGVPLCPSEAAWARMAVTEGRGEPGAECQWTQEPITVEFVRRHGRDGAVVRPRLTNWEAWVSVRDLQRP